MFQRLLSLLYPQGTATPYISASDKKEILLHPDICLSCQRRSDDGKTCIHCHDSYPLDGSLIGFSYADSIKCLVYDLKFNHKHHIASYLWERMAHLIMSNPYLAEISSNWSLAITSVPSHRRRHYITKWYNQSHLLASTIASNLTLPYIKTTQKNRATPSQLWLSRSQRKANLHNAFSLRSQLPELEKYTHILIIDDVTTTWTTFTEIAKAIKKSYPDIQVRWVAVTRH